MIDRFNDSKFLVSSWRRLLETQAPYTAIFFLDDRKITAKEILDVLEGNISDSVINEVIDKFLQESVSEAMRLVMGRFASGLDTNKNR